MERIENEEIVEKGTEEKVKIRKTTDQVPDSGSGKRKHFRGFSSRESGRDRSSGQKPPQSDQ